MYYSSGNYEAFARPRKPDGVENKMAWFVGSGLAALAGFVPLHPVAGNRGRQCARRVLLARQGRSKLFVAARHGESRRGRAY